MYKMKSNSPCRNNQDPITLEPLEGQVIEIGDGPKKNCYDPISLFALYRQAIETNRPFRDPLNPAYTISPEEIQNLIYLVKRQMGRKYRPPIPPPRPIYSQSSFLIEPYNTDYDKIVLDDATLGYLPVLPLEYSTQLRDRILQLWNQYRLLEDVQRGQAIGYHIRVPILKPLDYWKSSSKSQEQKFKELIQEADRYL